MTRKPLVPVLPEIRKQPSRRTFLKAASGVAAAGATLGFPMIAKGQAGPISMRWQSTWPSKDIFHEYALDFAKKVNDMTGGDLKIEVLPAGAVVPAFGLLDAVSKGTLDGGHGVLGYNYGKQNALALWDSGPGVRHGRQHAAVLAQVRRRQGTADQALRVHRRQRACRSSYGPMATQPLGWFKKPITKVDDFKGLKFRTNGPRHRPVHRDGRGGQCAARRRDRAGHGPRTARWRPNSTTPPPTASSASPTCPRCACCRATTRAPRRSRSRSTRPSTTRCRRR